LIAAQQLESKRRPMWPATVLLTVSKEGNGTMSFDDHARHAIKLWYCSACGQENTDEDVRCTQCHKAYEGEEMEDM